MSIITSFPGGSGGGGGGTSWDYSTDEVLTGQKWIDGKDIYCKVFSNGTNYWTVNSNWTDTGKILSGVDTIVDSYFPGKDSNGNYTKATVPCFMAIDKTNNHIMMLAPNIQGFVNRIVVYYTKSS